MPHWRSCSWLPGGCAPGELAGIVAVLGAGALDFAALLARPWTVLQITPEPVLLPALIGGPTALATPRVRWLPAAPLALSLAVLGALVSTTARRSQLLLAQSTEGRAATAPPGFRVAVFTQFNEPPTSMAFDGDGNLYVTTMSGSVLRLEDADGDGRPDRLTRFADSLGLPLGIAWHDASLFISTSETGLVQYAAWINLPRMEPPD